MAMPRGYGGQEYAQLSYGGSGTTVTQTIATNRPIVAPPPVVAVAPSNAPPEPVTVAVATPTLDSPPAPSRHHWWLWLLLIAIAAILVDQGRRWYLRNVSAEEE
jgi:hypothetical protein